MSNSSLSASGYDGREASISHPVTAQAKNKSTSSPLHLTTSKLAAKPYSSSSGGGEARRGTRASKKAFLLTGPIRLVLLAILCLSIGWMLYADFLLRSDDVATMTTMRSAEQSTMTRTQKPEPSTSTVSAERATASPTTPAVPHGTTTPSPSPSLRIDGGGETAFHTTAAPTATPATTTSTVAASTDDGVVVSEAVETASDDTTDTADDAEAPATTDVATTAVTSPTIAGPRGNLDIPLSLLVQHEGAEDRMTAALIRDNKLPADCANATTMRCSPTRRDTNPRLPRDLLPAWTLNTVDAACDDCVDRYAYDLAVRDAQLSGSRGVFAVPRSPRGLLGPMLFAMASVTDDVDVAAELPRWAWMRHVYSGFPAHGSTAPPRRTLLAVMGIPSTDHPARRTLRDAQRETWMSYSEVARSENGFEGALLPLFLFAAAEPFRPSAETGQAELETTAALCPLCNNVSTLLPTRDEFTVVSHAELAKERAGGPVAMGDAAVSVRRVQLRAEWRAADAAAASPCGRVVARAAVAGSAASWVAAMRAALSLPVTPAYVAPARYVCCTSAALWREALEYRNVVWLDMMADRRPTTAKKLGTSARWGMPAEIGMSQKQVLWFVYAYHTFRNVPYILKGDDDAYVKVPQFLSDLRYIRSGLKQRYKPSAVSEDSSALTEAEVSDTQYTVNNTECLYGGSMRSFRGSHFVAGMLILIHRTLVGTLLEQSYGPDEINRVRLAMDDYTGKYRRAYRSVLFDHEDIMLGRWIRAMHTRASETCLHHRVNYVRNGWQAFHDMHRGKVRNVTWATVVAHRCSPADAYFLHYFYQQEYQMTKRLAAAAAAVQTSTSSGVVPQREGLARALAAEWVAQQARRFAADGNHSKVTGWDAMPEVQWVENVRPRPSFVVASRDGVAVYDVAFKRWSHISSGVYDGFTARR